MSEEQLVATPDGVVGRDPLGDIWLRAERARARPVGIVPYRTATAHLDDERIVAAGLLPPGAARAIVIDFAGREHEAVTGAGAWLATLPRPPYPLGPPVRHLDAAGAVVARPAPARWARMPIADAADPCPACGATTWSRIADGDALCDRCGHLEPLGIVVGYARPDEPPEPSAVAHAVRRSRRDFAAILARAVVPAYGIPGRTPVPAGHGESSSGIDSLLVAHECAGGGILIGTDGARPGHDDELPTLARQQLESGLEPTAQPLRETSEAAVALWFAAQGRARLARAAAAIAGARVLEVDGEPVTFATASVEDRFGAAARHRGCLITITTPLTESPVSLRSIRASDLG